MRQKYHANEMMSKCVENETFTQSCFLTKIDYDDYNWSCVRAVDFGETLGLAVLARMCSYNNSCAWIRVSISHIYCIILYVIFIFIIIYSFPETPYTKSRQVYNQEMSRTTRFGNRHWQLPCKVPRINDNFWVYIYAFQKRNKKWTKIKCAFNKKLIMRWKYPNVTWPISFYLFTYLILSINIHWIRSSPIMHIVNLIQLKTFELGLDFAQ